MRAAALVIAAGLVVAGATLLQASPVPPTKANAYDGFAPGGRAIGMGLAFTAVGGDPASAYFNPAGLVEVTQSYFTVTYEATRQSELSTQQIFSSEVLRDRNFVFLGFVAPKGGLTWRPLANYKDHIVAPNGTDWEDVTVKANAFTLSAGHQYSQYFSAGLSLSYINGQIATAGLKENGTIPYNHLYDGNGAAMDIGMLYTPSEVLKLGLTLQNLAGFMWWEGYEAEQLPFTARAGMSFNISKYLIFASDYERRFYRKADAQSTVHFGLEQSLGGLLVLRGGIFGDDLNDKDTVHYTAGLGYNSNGYGLSLSMDNYRLEEKPVYRYVVSLNLPI